MDYKEYKELYNKLLSEKGRAEIGDDTKRTADLEKKINTFLAQYPSIVNPDNKKNAKVTELSIKEIVRRCVQTAIAVINDVSAIVSNKDQLSTETIRKRVVLAVTQPERRIYIGIWCIFFSFVFYFIDSAV